MMHNKTGKTQSDIDCAAICNYYNSHGCICHVASEAEDTLKKFDFMINGVKIDLKRYHCFYCEIDKLLKFENESSWIWYIIGGDLQHSCLVKREALVRTCAERIHDFHPNDMDSILEWRDNLDKNPNVTYGYGHHGDKLAYFKLSMLDESDYKIIDLRNVLRK